MSIPLYVFVQGDTLGLVVLAPESETVDELAKRLSRAAAPRVRLEGNPRVVHHGRPLRGELSLKEAGIAPLDRVELVEERHLG
jgi:hypothetical protein